MSKLTKKYVGVLVEYKRSPLEGRSPVSLFWTGLVSTPWSKSFFLFSFTEVKTNKLRKPKGEKEGRKQALATRKSRLSRALGMQLYYAR